jgi:hypothetical protein
MNVSTPRSQFSEDFDHAHEYLGIVSATVYRRLPGPDHKESSTMWSWLDWMYVQWELFH